MGPKWSRGSGGNDEEGLSEFERARRLIQRASGIAVFSGAGISVASGIPDFRSSGGLWERYDPFTYCDYSLFQKKPELFWRMVLDLYLDTHKVLGGTDAEALARNLRQPSPNPAHVALADLERKHNKRLTVVTQNIDGLHQAAGNTRVVELHGTQDSCTCVECGARATKEQVVSQIYDRGAFQALIRTGPAGGRTGGVDGAFVPTCLKCGGVLKANVIFFGEALPAGAMWRAARAVLASSLVLVVGSSLEVAPANLIPTLAKGKPFGKGKVVVINADDSGSDIADVFVQGRAEDILPRLVEAASEAPGAGQ